MGRGSLLAIAGITLSGSAAGAQPGLQAPTPDVPPQGPSLHKEGLFHGGISLELLDVGAFQAITSHGSASGADVGIAMQIDLGRRWALKIPIEFGFGGSKDGAHYGELAIIPGAIYRFRDRDGQRWVPYVGGGLRLGVVSIGKTLLGKPLDPVNVACCHDWHSDHGGGSSHSDPYMEDAGTTSPELWAGVAWNRTRWFSLQLAVALGYERVSATSVVVARETLGARFTF